MEREFLEQLALPEEAVETILEQHRRELDGVLFDSQLRAVIAEQGGRNHKAITALLDRESLLGAGDRETAIGQALEALKQECGYLFQTPVPPMYAPGTGGSTGVPEEPQSLAAALRERFEKR